MENKTYPGPYYQPLFDLLNQEHGITPLESEMADIIVVVEKMRGAKTPTGPRWVKAVDFKHEVGMPYHAKDSRSKGAGSFDESGIFKWGDDSLTLPDNQGDLFILDDTPEHLSDAVEFGNWLAIERWQPRINTEWARYETIYSDVSVKTTAELYDIFKKEDK
jgi:hypothetical protein